jgi:hypothetical protein
MLKQLLKISLALLLLVSAAPANAQRNCGAMEHLQNMILQDPSVLQNRQNIEQFTQNWITNNPQGNNSRALVTIPVVVHVVYRTTTENVSDAQIQSQMNVLNADFAKLNADWTNTPSVFQSLVANVDVQFCLAQRDPNGNASNGIVRKLTTSTSFSTNDNVKRSANGGSDAWPSSSYLNLWVCNISGGILGYAQFPGGSAATDGVVVNYNAFGTTGTAAAPFNKGRTATHEVGHWLNLYHIWGDDGTGCTGSDNVTDTPNQGDENYGCPSFPTASCSNGPNGDMYMNYMDYTDDACMFMFTNGQKVRMQALFATGGFRASLLNSLGCVPVNTTVCNSPTGLSASSVTNSGATLTWSAVSGATSYNVQYKTSSATTYTTVNTSATSFTLSGLATGTTYNYQVQTVCSSGSSSYTATGSFTTGTVAATCGTVTSLASSNVTSNSANVSWAAVSGAVSYNFDYKLSTASTFTTTSITGTGVSFTNLLPSTTYQYQVQAVCADAVGAYSTLGSFTTLAATTTCTDAYESNNTISVAKTIPVNTAITALINTSTDTDYFKFTNTSSQRRIQITLTNLPADYDVILYNSKKRQVAISQNSGTANETITFNTTTVGTYYFRVLGYGGAFNASNCYTLNANISATNFRLADDATDAADLDLAIDKPSVFDLTLAPNPSNGKLNISIFTTESMENANVQVYDLAGRVVFEQALGSVEAEFNTGIDLSALENGFYFVAIKNNSQVKQVQKIMIAK